MKKVGKLKITVDTSQVVEATNSLQELAAIVEKLRRDHNLIVSAVETTDTVNCVSVKRRLEF